MISNRKNLDAISRKIKAIEKRSIANVVEIGKLLEQAFSECEHGQYEDWLESNFGWSFSTARRKLIANGVKKLVPKEALLRDAYRSFVRGEQVRATVERVLAEADDNATAIAVPAKLKDQVEHYLKTNPACRWDEAVAQIARNAR